MPTLWSKTYKESFQAGLAATKDQAKKLAAKISDLTKQRRQIERTLTDAREKATETGLSIDQCTEELSLLRERISIYESLSADTGLEPGIDPTAVGEMIDEERRRALTAEGHIATLETLSFSSILAASTAGCQRG